MRQNPPAHTTPGSRCPRWRSARPPWCPGWPCRHCPGTDAGTTQEPEPTGGDGGESGDSGIKVFDSLDEAILFVAQNYNEQLTEEKDVRDFLKAHGINPRIKKG